MLIGCIIAGAAALLMCVLCVVCVLRNKKRREEEDVRAAKKAGQGPQLELTTLATAENTPRSGQQQGHTVTIQS